jgi:RNA polymerase sigma-70 factor (ECF subfamily)
MSSDSARQAEFLPVFLAHQVEIQAFIGALVRDGQARKDIFQDVSLILWKQFAEFDHSRSFAAWACGIAANKIKQHWAAHRRAPGALPDDVVAPVLEAFAQTEDVASARKEALFTCLEAVPDHARSLLRLRYEESLPLEEIAARLSRSLAATQKALSRLRQHLQECIERRLKSGIHHAG